MNHKYNHEVKLAQKAQNFSNIHIVLLRPSIPGNIGFTARAMKNMGLGNLILVDTIAHNAPEAKWTAADAADVLDRALYFERLEEAFQSFQLVVGTTRRSRKKKGAVMTPEQAALEAVGVAEKGRVAIVFGPEDRGLKNEEIELCHRISSIPSGREYPSLNLSHAVLIFCYELSRIKGVDPLNKRMPLADHAEILRMYSHLRESILKLDPGGRINVDQMLWSLKRLLGRTALEKCDVNLFHKLATLIEFAAVKGDVNNEKNK